MTCREASTSPGPRGKEEGFSEQRERGLGGDGASVVSLSTPRGSWRGSAVWT